VKGELNVDAHTPNRDELKAAFLWLARALVSSDTNPFAGSLSVRVVMHDEHETRILKPHRQVDGMTPPHWLALPTNDATKLPVQELLRVLLSPDEEKLLIDLLAHQPCSATSVYDRCKETLNKSGFWEVWGQLQKRDLVEQGDDERYRIAPDWLAKWLRAKSS
jgi:hypothetical protein